MAMKGCIFEKERDGLESLATHTGANKVSGGGKRVAHIRVCLSSPILQAGGLRQAVRVAGLSRACQWAVTHHCGSMGLMTSSNRMNEGCVGNRNRKRNRIQVVGRDVWQYKNGDDDCL